MDLVEKILKEGKQVGALYHYTNFDNFISILKNGLIHPSYESQKGYGVSTTRDKNFHVTSNRTQASIKGTSICIQLNGDSLSNKYKIAPYQADGYKDESEEFVVTNKGIPLNYFVKVSIYPDQYEGHEVDFHVAEYISQIITELKSKNIDYYLDEAYEEYINELLRD